MFAAPAEHQAFAGFVAVPVDGDAGIGTAGAEGDVVLEQHRSAFELKGVLVAELAARRRRDELGVIEAFGLKGVVPAGADAALGLPKVGQLVERLKKGGVTDAEVQTAISKLIAERAYARDGSFAQAEQLNECIAVGDWTLQVSLEEKIVHPVKPYSPGGPLHHRGRCRLLHNAPCQIDGRHEQGRTRRLGFVDPTV